MAALSTPPRWLESLPGWLAGSVAAAIGAETRVDPVHPRTGGPAGNARLTAWTGSLLLVLFVAEGLTLLNLRGLIDWHIILGAALIPPTALKIGSTGWRMVSYYVARASYRTAGPPPALLRVLGPFVILATVALLTTGTLLVLLGEERSRTSLATLAGLRIDWIWLHQASALAWVVVLGVHVLGRLLPTVRIAQQALERPRSVPGIALRLGALAAVAALAVGCAFLLVGADHSWTQGSSQQHGRDH